MELKKLTEVCSPKQWKTISQTEMLPEGYPVYGANGIIGYYNEYNHENPTVLITCRGATCGTLNISKPFSYVNGNAMALDNVIEDVDEKYLYYYLQSRGLKDIISGSAQPQITIQNLTKVIVSYPSIEEQKRIVSMLDKADEIRAKKKLANDKLDEFLKSTFISMFGDPVKNPKKMHIADIAQLATTDNAIKAGPFGSSLKKECYVEKGYKIYGQEQVINNDVNYGDYYIDERKYNSLKMYKVIAGDVLISLVGSYGKLLIIPEQYHAGIINPRLMKITFDKDKINPIFFKYLFANETFQLLLNNNSHGGTMGILNVGIIKKLKIIVPPINEQNKFAKIVEKVEVQKQKNELVIEQMNNLFNSLSQRAFKGEL